MTRLLIAFTCITLSACSRDPQQRFHQIDQSLKSWQSTITLAGKQWSADAIPTVYFRQILKTATKQLDSQQKQLTKTPADDPHHQSAQQLIADLRHRISNLNDLAAKKDYLGVRRLITS